MADLNWSPTFRCAWCQNQFSREQIHGVMAWVCPTEACRERQMKWAMLNNQQKLYFLPNPRQVELEEAVESRQYAAICFGGARGGAKSRAWRMIAQRYCRKLPRFTVLFLRRELGPLSDNHLRFISSECEQLDAKFVSMKMIFEETDSQIHFKHCKDPNDYKNYVGSEFDLVIFEQLEQFTKLQFIEIGAVAGRTEREDWRGLIGASENPNGPLSAFVDEIFVKKVVDRAKFPDYDPTQYYFLPSHLEDNPYVSKQYIHNLAGMDKEKREMYRYGRRDIFPNQFFKTWSPTDHVAAL